MSYALKIRLHLLNILAGINLERMKRKPTPTIASSGIVYEPRPAQESVSTYDRILDTGHVDAESLACWRVAELRLQGIKAELWINQEKHNGNNYYRVLVHHPDGTVEDPIEMLKKEKP